MPKQWVSSDKILVRDDQYFFLPAVHVNPNDSVVLTYFRSSATDNIYPTIGSSSMDPADKSMENFQALKGGESPLDNAVDVQEYGHYTDVSRDPANTDEYWTFGEYPDDSSNESEYGMWAANITA